MNKKFDYKTIPQERHDKMQFLFEQAIELILRRIETLKKNSGNEFLIKELTHGVDLLKIGKENFSKDEFKKLFFDSPVGKRPGLGLSRGFGEFLWHGYDWEKEIMAAIDDIENYFRNM